MRGEPPIREGMLLARQPGTDQKSVIVQLLLLYQASMYCSGHAEV